MKNNNSKISSDSSLLINEHNNNNINNNNNKIETGNNIDSEGLPILPQLETMKFSIEEYYSSNYPEYKIIKISNFTFIQMGRLLTFNFDKNNNYIPKYSIGPHWYATIFLLFIVLMLSIALSKTIFGYTKFSKKIIFYILIMIIYFFIFKTVLTHAKIVMNKRKRNADESGFCSICQVYFNPNNKVKHCNFCGVCAEKMDHHCVWVGKCVAKNNTFYFYGMIASVCIFYIYIIIIGISITFWK